MPYRLGSRIAGIQSSTDESAAAVNRIGGVIEQIAERSSAAAAAVEQQTAATRKIARNVAEAARGTQEVSSGILEVTGAVRRGRQRRVSGARHGKRPAVSGRYAARRGRFLPAGYQGGIERRYPVRPRPVHPAFGEICRFRAGVAPSMPGIPLRVAPEAPRA